MAVVYISVNAQTPISGIINIYAEVKSIDYCTGKITLSNAAGFFTGDKVLIVQMKGAVINETNTSSFGNIQNLGKAGTYEVASVRSVQGNEVFLNFALENLYDPTGKIQLVRVPRFQSAVVTDTLTALAWNGEYGGVLVIEVSGLLELKAPVHANGMGFRGALRNVQPSDCSFITIADGFHYGLNNWRGSPKGEGIAGSVLGKEQGRGALANGGGGGNDHNSGGGGGANAGAGGGGGEQNVGGFGCDGYFPGIGGKSLASFSDRMFMGGGGGSGHVNNIGAGSAGANGGGIVIIIASELKTNGFQISANGNMPLLANGDGAGGGGGGGTVFLNVQTARDEIFVHAKGGNGGLVNNSSDRCYGAGGGGGGGCIITNLIPGSNFITNGGLPGSNTVISAQCGTLSNGAKSGSPGRIAPLLTIPSSSRPLPVITVIEQPVSKTGCQNQNYFFEFKVDGDVQSYEWQVQTNNAWVNLQNSAIYNGVNTSRLEVLQSLSAPDSSHFRCVVKNDCSGEIISIPAILILKKAPTIDFSFSITEGMKVNFTSLAKGITNLSWDFGDGIKSTTANPEHIYSQGGTYEVNLSASGECGQSSTRKFIIIKIPPKADFKADITTGCTPLTIHFTNQSKGTGITSIQWEFQGGNPATSTDANPIVRYNNAGEFDVKLTVGSESGSHTTSIKSLVRVNASPKAAFTSFARAFEVTFVNNSTESSFYNWDFDDGSASSEKNPVHSFLTQGIFNIVLTAYNDACGSSVSKQISVTSTSTSNVNQPILKLFPNPTNELLYIEVPSYSKAMSVSIFDATGKCLWKGPLNIGRNRIDVKHLPPGIYFLKAAPNGQSLVSRFLISP